MLRPLAPDRWNFTTAAHLLSRAGFGGPPREVERLLQLGPQAAVAHLLDYEQIPDPTPDPSWAKPDPDRLEKLQTLRRADEKERRRLFLQALQLQRQQLIELRHWWLQRMATGPRPLQEKMTLFWHGHFATSITKVRESYLMWRQNDLLRCHATGLWRELLFAVATDPAMLIWLDQAQSRKEHPNENFARELMELFTLGEGHYTEKDVTESARALTGWSYQRLTQSFIQRPYWHDRGLKTIFGQTDSFAGEDVIDLILAQPQAARFIVAKIWCFFAGVPPDENLLAVLADIFRAEKCHFKPLLRAMFLAEEFYSPSILGNQVKSPVQWLVGSVRLLERELPPPIVCVGLTRNLGQELFAPPNVKGWDGGLSWINTTTLLTRYNEAATLVQGDISVLSGMRRRKRLDLKSAQSNSPSRNLWVGSAQVPKLLTESERGEKTELIGALEKRLLQVPLKAEQQQVVRQYLDTQPTLDDSVILNAIRLLMSTPEYQLT